MEEKLFETYKKLIKINSDVMMTSSSVIGSAEVRRKIRFRIRMLWNFTLTLINNYPTFFVTCRQTVKYLVFITSSRISIHLITKLLLIQFSNVQWTWCHLCFKTMHFTRVVGWKWKMKMKMKLEKIGNKHFRLKRYLHPILNLKKQVLVPLPLL